MGKTALTWASKLTSLSCSLLCKWEEMTVDRIKSDNTKRKSFSTFWHSVSIQLVALITIILLAILLATNVTSRGKVVLDHNNKPLHNIKENKHSPCFLRGQEEGSNHKYFYQVLGGKCGCKNQLQRWAWGETHTQRQTHYPPTHFWTKAFIFKMFGYVPQRSKEEVKKKP